MRPDDRSPTPLLIIGAGGMGREALWLARESREPFEVVGFLDDSPDHKGGRIDGVPVLGGVDDWRTQNAELIIAIGSPRWRKRVVGRIEQAGRPHFATLIHRMAAIGQNVSIGDGSMIAARATLTCDIVIGRHALILIGALVSHDCRLGNFTTVAPGVSIPGAVAAGDGCELALGAVVRQGVSLGEGSMIGMGSVVTRDVEPNMLVYGAPARLVRPLEPFAGNPE